LLKTKSKKNVKNKEVFLKKEQRVEKKIGLEKNKKRKEKDEEIKFFVLKEEKSTINKGFLIFFFGGAIEVLVKNDK